MWTRRQLFRLGTAFASTTFSAQHANSQTTRRLVLVHGRDQQNEDPAALKAAWIAALKAGVTAAGGQWPTTVDIQFPYYAKVLDDFAKAMDMPTSDDIRFKGAAPQSEYLQFQHGLLEELRQKKGLSDADVDRHYDGDVREKGPLNWRWVQALLRALDNQYPGLSQAALEKFTRDVYLYTTRITVQRAVDQIVEASLSTAPTVLVAHSLGTVVAYHTLQTTARTFRIPLFVTIGSPLGIRAIQNELKPLSSPRSVTTWLNAFDRRDGIALNPLDATNFPVTPPIENFNAIDNPSDTRHDAVGYLADTTIGGRIQTALMSL